MMGKELLPFVCILAGALVAVAAWAAGMGWAGAVCGSIFGAGMVLVLFNLGD